MPRLWLLAGSVVAVAALGGATFGAVSVIAHEEEATRGTFDATAVDVVRVDNHRGTVEVLGGDVDEITVTAEVSHGLFRTDTSAHVEDGALVVDMDCPPGPPLWCEADYRITVPADVAVEVDNGNGRTLVRDVDGDVAVDGRNGRIELVRVSGDVEAETSNGRITARGMRGARLEARSRNGSVRLAFAEPPTAVTARTENGSVDVVVPDDDEAYRVEVESFVGGTDTAVRTDPGSERVIVGLSRNGSVTVRYPTG
ncbi:MAG TPA: DUF4097 family beta strand repeat-containing protein [Acidimicrobiales bacterium]|nr:DUF4097 family beta strand repeat-containing protein [Acidimicrobiales bacterium]